MVTASSPSFGLARDGLELLWQWWLAEIGGLLPERLRKPAVAPSHRAGLLLQSDQITLFHIPPQGTVTTLGRFETSDRGLAELTQQLAALRRTDLKMKVGLLVPKGQCLERSAQVPRAAKKDIEAILQLEIANATPFAVDAIYWDYEMLPRVRNPDLLTVKYLIARRGVVDTAKHRLEQACLTVDFVGVLDEATSTLLGLDLMRLSRSKDVAASRPWIRYLVLGGTSALIAAVVSFINLQNTALRQLDQDILARRKIVAEQQALSKREMVRATASAELAALRSTQTRLADIWLALTRALPDTAWLSDLQLNGMEVEITGYAASAAGIVDMLSHAPEWADVTFKAPVIMDERAGREHFVLGLRLKGAAPAGPSRGAL